MESSSGPWGNVAYASPRLLPPGSVFVIILVAITAAIVYKEPMVISQDHFSFHNLNWLTQPRRKLFVYVLISKNTRGYLAAGTVDPRTPRATPGVCVLLHLSDLLSSAVTALTSFSNVQIVKIASIVKIAPG